MARSVQPQKAGHPPRITPASKYDSNNTVLSKTYGAFADLRRELADSKTAVAERTELLNHFSRCTDPQRAWLFLEDYFEKLRLARKDFAAHDWWPKLMQFTGKERLEETALLFMRSNRPVPTELFSYANFERLAEIQQAEEDQQVVRELEGWLAPRKLEVLDGARATLRMLCKVKPLEGSSLHGLSVEFAVTRLRTGVKHKGLSELADLHTRAAIEEKQFAPDDWEFVKWAAEYAAEAKQVPANLLLTGTHLLTWIARWGGSRRLELAEEPAHLTFHGELAHLVPHLEEVDAELALTNRFKLPSGETRNFQGAQFFAGVPQLVLLDHRFYIVRNAPSAALIAKWTEAPVVPVKKLSHRLLTHLRRHGHPSGGDWEQLCVAHKATPQFIFELADESLRLRLLARSERDQSIWQWDGHEWQPVDEKKRSAEKPEVLDDPRLEPAVQWLRRLDWFTPDPGTWVGEANVNFLNLLTAAWPDRPEQAEYLGNPAFQRLFLSSKPLRPKIILDSSGIDWFTVSAAWEQEGMKLTPADLRALQSATGRFVKLPDTGWVELDCNAVHAAHETLADLGLDALTAIPQKIPLVRATGWAECLQNY